MRDVSETSKKLFLLSTLVTLFEFSHKLLVRARDSSYFVPASEQTSFQWMLGGKTESDLYQKSTGNTVMMMLN